MWTSISRVGNSKMPTLSAAAVVGLISISILQAIIPAEAQDWPSRPVRIIVPNGAGGVSDILARLTADRLAKTFGQAFVIENRGGAGGTLGTEYAARSTGDGYTLYFGGGAQFLVNPLIRKLSYDPIRELTPISMMSLNGMALVVHPDLPVRSLRELIDHVKANPGKLNYGVAGLGQSSHLAPAALAAREGLNMVMVPYQATPQALVGLLSGVVQIFFGNISDVQELVQSGKARLLAISTRARLPQYPDVPTVSETVAEFVMTGWIGYFAPSGTPKTIIGRLSQALREICRDPEIVGTMRAMGIDTVGTSPEEFAAIIRDDLPMVRSAVESAGLLLK